MTVSICLSVNDNVKHVGQIYWTFHSLINWIVYYDFQRDYEEFKVRINGLVAMAQKVPEDGWTMQDGTPWPGNNVRDHPGMIQVNWMTWKFFFCSFYYFQIFELRLPFAYSCLIFYFPIGVPWSKWCPWFRWKWVTSPCLCFSWEETWVWTSQKGWCHECLGESFSEPDHELVFVLYWSMAMLMVCLTPHYR